MPVELPIAATFYYDQAVQGIKQFKKALDTIPQSVKKQQAIIDAIKDEMDTDREAMREKELRYQTIKEVEDEYFQRKVAAELHEQEYSEWEAERMAVWREGMKKKLEMQQQGIEMTNAEVVLAGEQALREKQLAEDRKKNLAEVRSSLMNFSIAMFVLGITMTQTFSSLAEAVGKTTDLGKAFIEMGNAVKFILGPLQVLTAVMQLITIEQKAMLVSGFGVMAVFMGIYLLIKAWNEESRTMKIILAVLGGALIAFGLALQFTAQAFWAKTIAAVTSMSVESFGLALPLLLGVIGASIAGVTAYMATLPKAQTAEGYMRRIRETGMFFGHRGEVVSRVGSMEPGGGGAGGTSVHVNINSGAIVTESVMDTMVDSITHAVRRGNGSNRVAWG